MTTNHHNEIKSTDILGFVLCLRGGAKKSKSKKSKSSKK